MRNIQYIVEDISLTNGNIIVIGSRDKYIVAMDTFTLKIFRYNDGRTINEKRTYEIVVQTAVDTDIIHIKTNDIILGVWNGSENLYILRPVFRRG